MGAHERRMKVHFLSDKPPMDEIKALKSEVSTLSPLFNNQIAALKLLEVESSPPFEETLPEID